jgi:hypothetical protein
MKFPNSPWADLFGKKEDQRLLSCLKAQNWQPDTCYPLIRELLNPLVQSLHFNSHSRWGLQIESQEIRALSVKFLEWMRQKNAWSPIVERAANSKLGFSLSTSLSRNFLRFQDETGLKKRDLTVSDREPSYSAKRSMLELPNPQTLSQMGGAIMDAFSSLTAQLPDDLRLPYQLHLEGLLDEEISCLVGLEIPETKRRILNAKTFLKEPSTWKRAS